MVDFDISSQPEKKKSRNPPDFALISPSACQSNDLTSVPKIRTFLEICSVHILNTSTPSPSSLHPLHATFSSSRTPFQSSSREDIAEHCLAQGFDQPSEATTHAPIAFFQHNGRSGTNIVSSRRRSNQHRPSAPRLGRRAIRPHQAVHLRARLCQATRRS